jgi:hypothetical protein
MRLLWTVRRYKKSDNFENNTDKIQIYVTRLKKQPNIRRILYTIWIELMKADFLDCNSMQWKKQNKRYIIRKMGRPILSSILQR